MPDTPETRRLRILRASDLNIVRTWRNHPSVRRFMYNQHEIQPAEHSCWFERAAADPDKHLFLFERGEQPAGFVSFTIVDRRAKRAEWGFYLAPDAAPNSGCALGLTALSYAFGSLDLHKVCGEALAYNQRSIRFHERLGFQREACLRDHHFDGQSYHDVVGFGLPHHDWLTHKGAPCR